MANNGSRYHAEIKIELEGREARINVFADTLNEIFKDIGIICTQFPQDWMSPARRDIINAQRKAATIQTQPPHIPNGRPDDDVPCCAHCGTSDSMELIDFTDRKTGQPRRAWKCQACNQWHFPDRKTK